jgi:Tol biopolymer transport system component
MMRTIVALGVLLLSAAAPAGAQYFGRNKVQYDRFVFSILQTPHFDVYYYASERDAARIAAQLAERWYARLSASLDHKFTRRQPVILYASHSHFVQTSIIPQTIGDGIGGFTDHFAGRVVLPFAAGLGETDHVLGHEIVHAFQRDILRQRGRSLAMLPLWFTEGMAEYLSVHELDANTRMWLRDSADADRLPAIAQLDDPRWFPYRYGQALWEFLATKYGEATVVKALQSRANGGAIGRLKDATGTDAATLSKEWHQFVRTTTDAKRVERGKAPDKSDARLTRIIGPDQNGGHMNVAPSISPDGRYVVFLSERDGYSVDVFLADAETGTVVRKLLATAADAHFDSLQFIESAGAWDPGGRRFVLATLRDGHPALTIFSMPDGEVRQELAVPAVDQIFSPTWSPDGAEIAFSALKGGVTDLFAVGVATGALLQLTTDAYSDLQPSWSPDGQRLVFATDRFSSSLARLSFGGYDLAILDLRTSMVRPLGGMSGGKNIDPHWSPDGASVYFVSDAGGVSNLHRVDVATGQVAQLTDVSTGVSGITSLSPAISIGAHGTRAAMSLYWRGTYEIRTMALALPSRNLLAATDPIGAVARPVAELTRPPVTEKETVLAPGGASPASGGASSAPTSERPYVARLSLAQIGSPYLSAGGGAFGSFVRAGISMGFGDMLGEQELDTAIQVGKEAVDNAVIATYMNRRSRWNWGLSGGRIPALVGASDALTRSTGPTGNALIVRDTNVLQQIHRQAAGVVAYPFNRAQRVEGSIGVDTIAFDERRTTTTYSAETGSTLSDVTIHRSGAPTATMIQTGAALVYDTAVFGAASPVLGQRYRLALAPAFGDLNVLTTVADYRRYFMPLRPFTLAFRAEGVARTGRDANDPRLLPLVWNVRDVVRGFDTDNDTIRTSRFAVANAEVRFPVIGLLRHDVSYGSLPLEALAFADCGRFWIPAASANAAFQLRPRNLCSAGVGTRINAAGFVFEFDAVRPFGPTSGGWRLGINFLPGF